MTTETFDWAAAIAARPEGRETRQLVAAYGNPQGPGWTPAAQRGWFNPSPTWRANELVRIPTAELPQFPPYPGSEVSGVTFHRTVAPVFVATWRELERRGLLGRLRTYDGALATRHMTNDPRRPLSTHAFGAAIDFDARWNGYGVPAERMQIDMDVVRCFEECGWTWGGRWLQGHADGMHFQWTKPVGGTPSPHQDAMALRGQDWTAEPTPEQLVVRPAPAAAPPPAVAAVPTRVYFNGQEMTGRRLELGNLVINAENPAKLFINLFPPQGEATEL